LPAFFVPGNEPSWLERVEGRKKANTRERGC